MITRTFGGEYVLALYLATCSREECENSGIPIEIWGDPESPEVGCGACGHDIAGEGLTLVTEEPGHSGDDREEG